MAAVSISKIRDEVFGRHDVKLVTLTLSASYATGGDPLTAHQLGLSEILHVFVTVRASGYVVQPDATLAHLVAYRQTAATSALVEVPSTTDLSAVKVDLLVVGRR